MKFFRSEILRNVAKMLTGNVAAQVVGILFYPLLTRLYSPDDFGVLNLFLSIGGVWVLVATAEYQYAIPLPKNEKKAVSVFQGGFLIMLGVVFLSVLTVFFRNPISMLFKAPELAAFYPLIPLYVLLSAAWVLFAFWFTRLKKFGIISLYQLTLTSSNSLLKYGFGLAGKLQWGLFTSTLASLFIGLGTMLSVSFKSWWNRLRHFDMHQIRMALKRYARFPAFSLPRNLINNLSSNMPFFLLTPAFGLSAMGYLGLAFTLAFRPMHMISHSIYHVFLQKMSEKTQNREPLSPMFRKFVYGSFVVIVPIFIGLYFILPELCGWLLGAGWETTGELIGLLLPWICVFFVANSVSCISDIFQKQAAMLVVEIVYFFLRIGALSIGIYTKDLRTAILLFSLSGTLVLLIQLFLYARFIRTYEREFPYPPCSSAAIKN